MVTNDSTGQSKRSTHAVFMERVKIELPNASAVTYLGIYLGGYFIPAFGIPRFLGPAYIIY